MSGTRTGRLWLVLGVAAGMFTWLLTVGVPVATRASVYDVLSARSIAGGIGIVFVLAASAPYYLREHSLTRTAYAGFFFGFTIGYGILAIPTDPAFQVAALG